MQEWCDVITTLTDSLWSRNGQERQQEYFLPDFFLPLHWSIFLHQLCHLLFSSSDLLPDLLEDLKRHHKDVLSVYIPIFLNPLSA
jgi:hypothetical protein